MGETMAVRDVRAALDELLVETFEQVGGSYLDRGTSFFETLEGMPAAVASQAASDRVASLAAQIEHVAYYLEVLLTHLKAGGEAEGFRADWSLAWQRGAVGDEEWRALVDTLRERYNETRAVLATYEVWNEDTVGGWMSILVHTGYHLGEVRQALGVIPPAAASGG